MGFLRDGAGSTSDLLIIALLILFLAVVSFLHYTTGPQFHEYHSFHRALYHLPVIFAAFRFGIKGGVITALAASLLYAPYLFWLREQASPLVLDVLLLNFVGWATGFLVEGERRQRRAYQGLFLQHRDALQDLALRSQTLEKMHQELQTRVAEKGRLEEQVRQADRLAALGRMAAGLAHEIRNPAGIIKTTAQLLQKEFPNPELEEYIRVIVAEADRLNRILSDFLDFARPKKPERTLLDINELLEESVAIMERYLSERKVEVVKEYSPGPLLVLADGNQLKQVFFNLMMNAAEAMPGGGRIFVRTSSDGDRVRLDLRDTGQGIVPADRERIFEPFFTTKEGGTGLGLAVAHRIIDLHAGIITVQSEPGLGSTFTIRLPAKQGLG
ncbi:MAG: ATP-binding protein [Firmicutes bacterium]|nr:ATP-binding protein [Bacillota bacterium]MCL5039908.1 ATP-binding protein [Bacillota bacterium]